VGQNSVEEKRGNPRKTPYADAHRVIADLPVTELQDSPDDTVAIRMAKHVALQGIDGKIAYAVEAANRTEGKPREMDKPENPPDQKIDSVTMLKLIRRMYGIEDPPDPAEGGPE
jgi:hypothetical protein